MLGVLGNGGWRLVVAGGRCRCDGDEWEMADAPADAPEAERRILFSEKFACPVSGFTIAEIEPRLFSFNAPFGACPDCDGLGVELFFDKALIVPDAKGSNARQAPTTEPILVFSVRDLSA